MTDFCTLLNTSTGEISTLSYEAWKRYPFRVEPPIIESSSPPGTEGSITWYTMYISDASPFGNRLSSDTSGMSLSWTGLHCQGKYCDFFVCPYCYFRQCFKLFVGNNSITAPPVLFSSSRFLNLAGPTISEPGTGYNSCHTWNLNACSQSRGFSKGTQRLW